MVDASKILTPVAVEAITNVANAFFDAQKHEVTVKAQAKVLMNQQDNITKRVVAEIQKECYLEEKRLDAARDVVEQGIDSATKIALALIEKNQFDSAIQFHATVLESTISKIDRHPSEDNLKLISTARLLNK